jgi:peptide/nickel transport system permease protein
MTQHRESYWKEIWNHFYRQHLGRWALYVIGLFCLVGVFAPFLASSKPLFLMYQGEPYFPLFRYLLYSGFFTKRLDIFFNLFIYTLPLFILAFRIFRNKKRLVILSMIVAIQFIAFTYFAYFPTKDPSSNSQLNIERENAIKAKETRLPNWNFDLKFMNNYAKLNLLLRHSQRETQQKALLPYLAAYTAGTGKTALPTLWQIDRSNEDEKIAHYNSIMEEHPNTELFHEAQNQLQYILDKRAWLEKQSKQIKFKIMPLLSPFHWEDDAGGQQSLNKYVPWWNLTRINRKDLLSALIFGVRISLVVGITAVALSLIIGIPIGALAGYYGGKLDIIVCRLLEIWEAMPVFFMLLMVVAILQTKSIFVVITVIGLFSWTGFSRYIRGEFFKQRNLAYVEACKSLGFRDRYIMFKHILPNAIPPVLTLLPFAMMAAITSEAGLSFLGLGEEGSCSWGVLMDEGRTAFPAESYLLWPPAVLLTILLVAIAIVGDRLRDSLDPKLRR